MFSKKQNHISSQPVNHNIEKIKYEKIQEIKDTIKSKPISFLSCHQEKLLKKIDNYSNQIHSKNPTILSKQNRMINILLEIIDTSLKNKDPNNKDPKNINLKNINLNDTDLRNLVAIWVKKAKNCTSIDNVDSKKTRIFFKLKNKFFDKAPLKSIKHTAKLSKNLDDVDSNDDVDSKKTPSFFKSKNKLFDKAFLKSIKDTAELSTHLKEADHPYANKIYRLIEKKIDETERELRKQSEAEEPAIGMR